MLNTLKPFDVVCFWDPAIDLEKTNYAEYAKTRDFKKLTFLPGKKPTVYRCRPLSNAYALGVVACQKEETLSYLEAFRYSVFEVRNADLRDGRTDATVSPRAAADTAHMADENGAPPRTLEGLWTDHELETMFSPLVIMEIGAVVKTHAFLDPRTDPIYLPPPTCLEQGSRNVMLRVAQLSTDQSAKTASDASLGATQKSVESDAPGAVDAMGLATDSAAESLTSELRTSAGA
jgi:hypothetical protein